MTIRLGTKCHYEFCYGCVVEWNHIQAHGHGTGCPLDQAQQRYDAVYHDATYHTNDYMFPHIAGAFSDDGSDSDGYTQLGRLTEEDIRALLRDSDSEE